MLHSRNYPIVALQKKKVQSASYVRITGPPHSIETV